MFPTRYRPHERFVSEVGSTVKILYSPVFDKRGVMTLEQSGQEDFYGYIQSFRDSVDLHKILERYASGDAAALNQVQGAYGDFSELPSTYADLLNTVIDGERTFDTLPIEIKQQFGNSFHQWLVQSGTPEWYAAMGIDPPAPPVVEPVPVPDPSSIGGDTSPVGDPSPDKKN